jgi:hypothetical protein
LVLPPSKKTPISRENRLSWGKDQDVLKIEWENMDHPALK